MNPLSVITYYRNNRKRFFAVFTAVFLSVFLLYVIQILVDSSFYMNELGFVEPQKYYSSITPRGTLIDPELPECLKSWESVKKVMPWHFQYTNFHCMIGGETGMKVYTVMAPDMPELMSLLQVKLIEGRFPEPNKNEIVLHHLLAKNKELSIGDEFGSHINRYEPLKGSYQITGILDGKSIVSFTCLENWMELNEVYNPYTFGVILLPEKGKLQEMNRRLENLSLTDLELRTIDIVQVRSYESTRGFRVILNLINLMVILIVSLCVGFLTYIYIIQRNREFALLRAMGFSRQEVFLRSFLEICFLCFISYVSGILAAIVCGFMAQWFVFSPSGQILRLVKLDFLIKTFSVPLFAAIFSIIPIWKLFTGLDPVSVLEGGDDR